MIKRDKDAVDGPPASTYLAMAMADDVGGVKPAVVGATEVPVALPASGPWAGGDPCGIEPPLNFSIDEVGAALGGASSEPLHSSVEIAAPAQVSGAGSGER